MRAGHAQVAGVAVHPLGECALAAGDVFCQCHAGVVTRLDNDAAQQVFHGDRGADFHKHAGAAGTPGVFTDRDFLLLGEVALLDFRKGDVGGHQLGDAGGFDTHVRVASGQLLAAVEVDQQEARGVEVGRLRRRHGRQDHRAVNQGDEAGDDGGEQESGHGAFGVL